MSQKVKVKKGKNQKAGKKRGDRHHQKMRQEQEIYVQGKKKGRKKEDIIGNTPRKHHKEERLDTKEIGKSPTYEEKIQSLEKVYERSSTES